MILNFALAFLLVQTPDPWQPLRYLSGSWTGTANLVFVSESLENIGAGWRARETYRIVSTDEFIERFDLAAPGKDFELYSESRFRRQSAPDLELKDTAGQTHRLSDYRGKPVVLNFWATWCVPCQKEMPLLSALHEEYSNRGVQFIAASIDDETTSKDIPAFLQKYRVDMPVWVGATPEQQFSFKLARAVPATIIIDRDGTMKFRIIGEVTREVLTERLDWLLTDGSQPAPADLVLPPSITREHFAGHEAGLEDEHEEEQTPGSEVPS